ncbi:MAG TPA: hypothetical protein VF824_22080 [Thermoanaerobaculia bacterium]|jgi:hypothetical protein
MEQHEHTTAIEQQSEQLDEHVERLRAVLQHSRDAKATKNISEHLNCTKQSCFSAWT